MNSRNADGNLGADFIGNSWITNLFKQINFSTEEDLNAGLNKLREFVSLSDQYKYNPILLINMMNEVEKLVGDYLILMNKEKRLLILMQDNY